jgi:aldehyde dehydrogenase (NAD+)
MQEEIFGPVLVSTTFRTPAEAVQLANNTRYGLAATVWTENLNLALDIAPKLAAGVVWVNATNLFDAAAPFGGCAKAGSGAKAAGKGCGLSEARIALKPAKPVDPRTRPRDRRCPGLDRTAKMYVGGKQARPDGGYSRPRLFETGQASGPCRDRQPQGYPQRGGGRARAPAGWAKTTGHLRAQILYYIAENLSARADEFAGASVRPDRPSAAKAEAEVEAAVDRLFTYAAWADKFDGARQGVPIRGVALAMREPVGVIGLLPGRRAAARGGLPDGAGHRDGQPRGAGPVRAPSRWRRPISTRCSTPRTCRAAW